MLLHVFDKTSRLPLCGTSDGDGFISEDSALLIRPGGVCDECLRILKMIGAAMNKDAFVR